MSNDEDEAYVEVEEDPYVPVNQKPGESPEIQYWKYAFLSYLTNPWLLLGLALILYFYVYKKLKPWIEVRFLFYRPDKVFCYCGREMEITKDFLAGMVGQSTSPNSRSTLSRRCEKKSW